MPFLSEAASAIKNKFRFHDHSSSDSASLIQNTPDLLKSDAKQNLFPHSEASLVLTTTAAVSSSHTFEVCEDPSFWKDHNVQVIIRMRPLSNAEISVQGYSKCVRQESCQAITWTGHPESRFTFDVVADENVSQEKLFKVAGLPMVENCMGGYNSCMFAYGQTGSGKTHTMLGDIEGGTRRHSVNCGMTPRIFEHLFSRIQKEKEVRRDEKLKFTCKCSFLEIYNEQILDLLDPSSNNLQIREDSKKGVYVENLKEVEVTNARDVIQQLIQGAANRKVAATNMNHASSRSHSVFTCIIESQWESQGVTHFRFARLNLVDLAGSERQKSSGAEGERLKEATNINKSLSTLGLVIMNLVSISNGKSLHVPYRDSKLTFLLQDSLGGNSKTIIIANISPSISCSLETLSTLKFAQRAKFIKNNAIVNEDASGDVIAMRIQIQQLKKEVSHLRGLVGGGGEVQDNDVSIISFPGSPGSFKWEGGQGSFSPFPLASAKKISQKKDYEVALVGAFRREKDKDMSMQALREENQAALKLAKQREDEIQGLKMRLRFREARIKRLEAVASGKISAETCLLNEKEEHLKEIEVLRGQVDRNQEVTRFAMENLQLKEEIRRLKSFYEEGEREMMNEQITVLQNKLLEALDWKFMHEQDLKTNTDSVMEDVHSDSNLIFNEESSPKSRWQSSLRAENEFLRIEAIQNQAETDTIRKRLEVCLEEKEKLEKHVDDLTAKFEQENALSTKEEKEQKDLPLATDMPVINIHDQMELKAMVDAIAAASHREAEAHEMAIMLSKENDELRMKLKALIEDNSKLIELYEQASAESKNGNDDKMENAQEIGSKVDNLETREEVTELKRVIENLEHQLTEINEENEKLMSLYETAMQERDDLKRALDCSAIEKIETKRETERPEKLVQVDGGESDFSFEIVSLDAQGRGESKNPDSSPTSRPAHEEENFLEVENEVDMDIEVNSDMGTEVSSLTAEKLSEELNCVRKKLESVDDKISEAVRKLSSLGCTEKAMMEVDKLSREIEVIEHDIRVKCQHFESLKLQLSGAQERRTVVNKKFSALKYSLSSFSSSFSYFEQREVRARAGVKDLTSHLDRKRNKLSSLQASKEGLVNAQKKNQESEVELMRKIACIKSKLEEENRKRQGEKVLFAIDNNTQNTHSSLKSWHFSGKATELLKLEEEKTKIQAEMKLSQEKLGFIRKELGSINKKVADVESQIQAVKLEIQQGLSNTEEKKLALQCVTKEKEMLVEFRDNGILEIEQMTVELQQYVFECDVKEAEMKIVEEELEIDFAKAEELQITRVIVANSRNNSMSTLSHPGMCEKIEEDMQSLRASIIETKLLLEGISHAT
ncbi:PREDICTED: kinesin-like protein KIN-12E [Lupinus angustifolius]|uniref:kinesin-like protein KIN-12E n=1 Tax=Lupinus angustifolius TaxID=3871 RepID=UPI00092F5486|nr:PREDICTED: kinesin-like protein KIN-12E [Lupinus angustifolius]